MPAHPPPRVVFLNENALGHVSYLPRFVQELRRRPDLGILPEIVDLVPLPTSIARHADRTIPFLRRFGLDFHAARWRLAVSRYARQELTRLRRTGPVDAVVANTQSVALDLADAAAELPVFVALDATLAQLSRTAWLAPNPTAKAFLPLTLAPLRARERRIFQRAHRLLPWSVPVRDSLIREYRVPEDRLGLLPPSLDLDRLRPGTESRPVGTRPQLLFLGGDFRRKGGPILLDTFLRHFADRGELHLVTETRFPAPPHAHVHVHRDVWAGSDSWRRRWQAADVFLFPSTLETFGIVLLEAMAFEVPVISTRVGAAVDLLENGERGLLLPGEKPTVDTLREALEIVLGNPPAARERARRARARVERDFDLARNTELLARWLHQSVRR